MGALGIKGDDRDRYALGVTNQVLGSSAASRLFMNLREDKGYTYGAYSGVSLGRYPGVVVANAEVRTEVTDGAMKEFMYELKRIGTEPVGDVELANAKRAIVGRFALALEDPRTFISYVFEQKIYGFPADYWDHYAERVDAISAADVQKMGAKYFDPKHFQIIAVGDAAKIKDVMKTYESQ
jgi:predicted Zn-dependent peptidase